MSGPYEQTLKEVWDTFKSNPSLYGVVLQNYKPSITPRRIYVACPRCNDRSGWLLPGDDSIKCNHENNCGGRTPLLGLLSGGLDSPTGDEFKKAVRDLAEIAGVTPPAAKERTNHNQEMRADKDVIATIWKVAREQLANVDPFVDNDGYDYLCSRGFAPDFIAASFGYLPSVAQLLAVLSDAELREAGVLDSRISLPEQRWNKRVILPGYDVNGKLVGLISRSLEKPDPPDKYRCTTGFSPAKVGGFGLNEAKKAVAKNGGRVILVEGIFDVVTLNSKGIKNVIAAGTNRFSADNLHALTRHGIREVCTALDSDNAGANGLWSLLDAADATPDTPECYVLDHLDGAKDPDEFLQTHATDVFLQRVDGAAHSLKWRARKWFAALRTDESGIPLDGQIAQYIDRCARYGESIDDKRFEFRIKSYFLPEVCRLAGIDVWQIQEIRDEIKSAAQHKRQSELLAKTLSEGAALAREGNLALAQDRAVVALECAQQGTSTVYSSKVAMGESVIQETESFLRRIASREFIGIPVKSLPALDNHLLGLRGLILLAGSTNVGKTIMLGQLAMDAVRHNPDTCVLFLTIEMSRKSLVSRMWSRLAQVRWWNLADIYRENNNGNREAIIAARDELMPYMESIKILHPRSEKMPISEKVIINEMLDLKYRTGKSRCMVIVDYLDVLPTPPGYEHADRTEIEKALCDQLLNVKDAMDEEDPLIAVTEVRKRDTKNRGIPIEIDDLMGASRKAYCGDTVLIWNRFTDKMYYESFALNEGRVDTLPSPYDVTDTDMKKPQVMQAVREMRRICDRKGIDFGRVQVAKVRDGGHKGSFDITVHFTKNDIIEGLEP